MDFEKIYRIITQLCVFLVILLSPLIIISNYTPTYYEALEYRAQHELNNATSYMDEITSFLFGNSELTSFTYEEASHMQDVKNLLIASIIFLGVWILVIFNYLTIKGFDKNIFIKPSLTVLITIFFLGIVSFLNFNISFEYFHRIFFPMGNYVFPYDSLLITLFPQEFFYKKSMEIIFYTSLLSIITIILSFLLSNYQGTGKINRLYRP